MSLREILRAIRARRDFYAETPGHDEHGRGWYLGGNLLDESTSEYQLGGGADLLGRYVHANFSRCSCGEWGFHVYLERPSSWTNPPARSRVWIDWFAGERPRAGIQRFPVTT